MRIVGVLSWYDESPAWLAAAVAGYGRFCDAIVACDGAYALFPGARPRSHPDQADAIVAACEAADVECVVHRPRDVYWGNEVEKRNQTLALAGSIRPDWVVVFDGDYLPMRVEPDRIRGELEQTDRNVATYTLLDGKDMLSDEATADLAAHSAIDTEWTLRDRGLFRWTPDLRYEGTHYMVRGTYGGQDVWVRGPELHRETAGQSVSAFDLNARLVVVHRRHKRALVRQYGADGYYRNREVAGVERLEELVA